MWGFWNHKPHPPPKWQPSTPAIEIAALDEVMAQHPIIVLHGWAIWNGLDREMDKMLAELRPEYADRIEFYSINMDDNQYWTATKEWEVDTLPALVCLVDGQWFETLVGLRDKRSWKKFLNNWIERKINRV